MNPPASEIKILIVDDHPLMRQGVRHLISAQAGLTVVGEAFDSRSALEQVRTLNPHVVLMDVHLPGENGVEITRRILAEFPAIKVVALSSDSGGEIVLQALRAGAAGYVVKESNPDDLIRAIRDAADHRMYLSPEVSSVVIKDLLMPVSDRKFVRPGGVLTERERVLLKLVAEGKRNKEIAGILALAVKSVETGRTRLMKKVGCAGTADLVRYAIREGIVEA